MADIQQAFERHHMRELEQEVGLAGPSPGCSDSSSFGIRTTYRPVGLAGPSPG